MSTPAGPAGVVIVGASVAGAHTAHQLRQRGFAGRITLVGDESHQPYDRPPLSKQLQTDDQVQVQDIQLYPADRLGDLDLDLRLGVPAAGLDGTTVRLADGSALEGAHVVVATGLRARRLPGQPASARIRTLRTLDDALALRAALRDANRIAIVGGGLIGGEIASAARTLGVDAVVVEAGPLPLLAAVGPVAGQRVAELWRAAGVELRLDAQVSATSADATSATVLLADDQPVRADLVLVCIGGVPNVEWMGPLPVRDIGVGGLPCDEHGRVEGLASVYAVGDIAAWPDATGRRRREHWMSARTQADVVAAHICGAPAPRAGVDYAWSDQFGVKLQLLGSRGSGAEDVLLEHATPRTVVGHFRDGRPSGFTLIAAPERMPVYRKHLLAGTPRDELCTTVAGQPAP